MLNKKHGEVGSLVSSWFPSSNSYTPAALTSSYIPYGLILRQTLNAGATSVTIPSGVTWVYAIAVGGGQSGDRFNGTGDGGTAGEVAWGWTPASSSCVVGVGGSGTLAVGGYTRYGHIMARGGVIQSNIVNTNMYGISIGNDTTTIVGSTGSRGFTIANIGVGGSGISGGGSSGGPAGVTGGSGLAGGGAGSDGTNSVVRSGGSGFNLLTGVITTGGAGVAPAIAGRGTGGGGGGVAGNGGNGTTLGLGGAGGLGGGGGGASSGSAYASGNGGDGILYLFY